MARNLTLVIEDDILLEARKIALDRHTSVNQMVRDYLVTLVDRESRIKQARMRLKKAFAKGIVETGKRTWSRDDLYER